MIDLETGEIVGIEQPICRTLYNYNRDERSNETATTCEIETKTQQHQRDEVDINKIVELFGITQELPNKIRAVMPEDYGNVVDFKSAMDTLREAEVAFMAYPAGVRARFSNSPQIFMEFFADPENRHEAEKMGLVIQRPREEPKEAPKPVEPAKE